MSLINVSPVKAQGSSIPAKSTLTLGVWLLACVLPFTPFFKGLLTNSLADTPYAYLVWVPVFAFIWAIWSLRRVDSYLDDPELNVLIALPLLIACGVFLVHGLGQGWRYFFLGHQLAIVIWPIWALFMAWLLFGVGVTGRLWRPLAYLFLAWPPLYADFVNFTNPILQSIANTGVKLFAGFTPWISVGSAPGTYLISYDGHVTPVYVSSACSGADSFIAMVILIPIVLVTLKGSLLKKLYTTLTGVVLSLAANVFRLALIIFTLHFAGPKVALDILHPVLGIILFVALWWLVMRTGKWFGLASNVPTRTTYLHGPGYLRMAMSGVSVLGLTGSLWYYQPKQGSVVHPISVSTSTLTKLMPHLPGWTKKVIGNYNEASVLGTGASTTAAGYYSFQGDYALTELWWSYRPMTLQGYGVQDCLLFHGYKILGRSSMKLTKDITATSYLAMLPPAHQGATQQVFVDTVYEVAVRYHGRQALIRVETATPIEKVQSTAQETQLKSLASQLPLLMQPPFPAKQTFSGFSRNQVAHLYNYFIFVRQFGGTLLGPKSIINYPPFAQS